MSFLKDLAAFVRQVLVLSKELEQNRADTKELQKDVLNLTLTVQRLADEIRLSAERESSGREKLALRLENELLKFERRLPPAGTTSKKGRGERQSRGRRGRWTLARGAW